MIGHDPNWMSKLPPLESAAARKLGFGSQTPDQRPTTRRRKTLPGNWRELIWKMCAGSLLASKEQIAAQMGMSRKTLLARLRNANDELTVAINNAKAHRLSVIAEGSLALAMSGAQTKEAEDARRWWLTRLAPEQFNQNIHAQAAQKAPVVNVDARQQLAIIPRAMTRDEWAQLTGPPK